jgi:hypothetical protein
MFRVTFDELAGVVTLVHGDRGLSAESPWQDSTGTARSLAGKLTGERQADRKPEPGDCDTAPPPPEAYIGRHDAARTPLRAGHVAAVHCGPLDGPECIVIRNGGDGHATAVRAAAGTGPIRWSEPHT